MSETFLLSLDAATSIRLRTGAHLLGLQPEALAERLLTLALASADRDPGERRQGFAALCELRAELFVAGLGEEDAP